MGLAQQLAGFEPQRLLEFSQFFIARRIGHPAGLDEGEVRLGDAGPSGQLIEGEPQTPALTAKFGSERFHFIVKQPPSLAGLLRPDV